MVFKAGEQGHQALPPAADGRQVQEADSLEAVLDGSRSRRQQSTATSSMLQSPVAHGSIVAAAKRMSSAPCRARSAAAYSMHHTHTMAIFRVADMCILSHVMVLCGC